MNDKEGETFMSKKTRCRVLSLLLALCAVWFLGTEVYLISGARTDDTTPCQYIVVLGAQVRGTQPSRAMRDRTDAAAAYLSAHPDVICIVSGGQGPGEKITEAAWQLTRRDALTMNC